MKRSSIQIADAKYTELNDINQVITAAIQQWNLPERVKRLSLPSYLYDEQDFKHLKMIVAKQDNNIIGIASWEPASSTDTPDNQKGLLLHGLYVHPDGQHQGVAKKLLNTVENAAREQNFDGLLVKAQADATSFFIHQGMNEINIQNESRDYAHRLWKCTKTKYN